VAGSAGEDELMPQLPPRMCAEPGCVEMATEGGRCGRHRREMDLRRGKTAARGYDAAHRRLREARLAANPICQIRTHCQGAVATEMDHIVPIEEAPELRLVWENTQSACKACNVAKGQKSGGKAENSAGISGRFVGAGVVG
jgi:5-methylcytosine-specific restriction enzyme A